MTCFSRDNPSVMQKTARLLTEADYKSQKEQCSLQRRFKESSRGGEGEVGNQREGEGEGSWGQHRSGRGPGKIFRRKLRRRRSLLRNRTMYRRQLWQKVTGWSLQTDTLRQNLNAAECPQIWWINGKPGCSNVYLCWNVMSGLSWVGICWQIVKLVGSCSINSDDLLHETCLLPTCVGLIL